MTAALARIVIVQFVGRANPVLNINPRGHRSAGDAGGARVARDAEVIALSVDRLRWI